MKTIKELFDELAKITHDLAALATESDEFVAVNEIELDAHEARKVFERTKDII